MLITTPQPHLAPHGYFGADAPRPGLAPAWVVHTRPRAEKKLAERLAAAGIGHYLPTMQTRHVYGNRVPRTHWVPVFPGYVFVLAEHFARLEVFRSHAAVQLLPVPNPAALYHDLSHLFRTLVARPSAVEESLYQPGVRVEVVSGPLAGVEGELIRSRQGGTRLLVAVRLFERGITVDIDAAHVRRL